MEIRSVYCAKGFSNQLIPRKESALRKMNGSNEHTLTNSEVFLTWKFCCVIVYLYQVDLNIRLCLGLLETLPPKALVHVEYSKIYFSNSVLKFLSLLYYYPCDRIKWILNPQHSCHVFGQSVILGHIQSILFTV